MTDADDRDMLAAEYVLGTLPAGERDGVAAQLAVDAELARAVRDWEDRLSPLIGAVADVAPPADAYAGIASRLFGEPPAGNVPSHDVSVAGLRRRLRRWQGATAGFAALAAAALAWVAVLGGQPARGAQRFTAVLQRDAGAPAMLVEVDVSTRRFTVRPFAAMPPAGRVYELWIIDPALGTPRSLGLLPADGDARGPRETLRPFDPGVITGATYAVTVEPVGGSPTGRPTTAPIMSGKLVGIPS